VRVGHPLQPATLFQPIDDTGKRRRVDSHRSANVSRGQWPVPRHQVENLDVTRVEIDPRTDHVVQLLKPPYQIAQ
jgi:hypothetical protein